MSEYIVPPHFNPDNASKLIQIKYNSLASSAKEWAKKHNICPADTDQPKICLMLIDCQNTFCLPTGELYVASAEDDTNRICSFIYRNIGHISNIVVTLDTHFPIQIFYPLFWSDSKGNNPEPNTLITLDDLTAGKWIVNPAAGSFFDVDYTTLQKYATHYIKKLSENGKYNLMIWPYHGMIGGVGHALVGSIEEAVFFHGMARDTMASLEIKGTNPFTENYSVFKPEVTYDHFGQPITQGESSDLINRLQRFDIVVIAGQAKSHCVAWTVRDLIGQVASEFVEKIYLLEDCTSPVVIPSVIDFTEEANNIFRDFVEAGVNVVRSTDDILNWI